MADLTTNINYLQPTSFKITIDRKHYPNLEYFCQSFIHPGIMLNAVDVSYRKITSIPMVGDKLTFNELLCNILIDEELNSYNEMHNWIRRILDQDEITPINRNSKVPPSMSDITLSILSSHNNKTKNIRYIDCIPTALTDIQFESTASGNEFLIFGASFRFSYFELV